MERDIPAELLTGKNQEERRKQIEALERYKASVRQSLPIWISEAPKRTPQRPSAAHAFALWLIS